ncbi:MAG: alpha-amylase family glycosyl hydrolase [Candidatus Saccharimonas sp.]
MKAWTDVNAIYQIYPRSFMDSNGDGVGDLKGVIQKLDHLKGQKDSLGVDAIWFSPLYPSPMVDFGYDVSNYCDIDPIYGNIADIKQLIHEAHKRDIFVMMDFVPNHSSDQHPWFVESKRNSRGPWSDFYVWRDPKPDGSAPNNWLSIFGGSAWEFCPERQQYYLHTFLKEQPDLNWDNPLVRTEMKQVLRFWFDLGIDGFRADAVRWLSKDPAFRDNPKNPAFRKGIDKDQYHSQLQKYSRFWKNLFPYLREITDIVAEYDNRIMIFEDSPDPVLNIKEQYLGFYGVNSKVSMPFNFEGTWLEFYADAFRKFITEFQGMLNPNEHTPVYCFSNHDQMRLVTRFGEEQARLIALMQLSLPGLPVIYYGDEIGMPNTAIAPEDMLDTAQFTNVGLNYGRDPQRTPMQWEVGHGAGFTTGTPWLPIGANLKKHNVASQLAEPDSFLALYRRLLKLRNRHTVLRRGDYETFGELESDIFVFSRRHNNEHVFVVLNFGGAENTFRLPHGGRVLCCTHPVDYPNIDADGTITLRPYEGAIVECSKHPLGGNE